MIAWVNSTVFAEPPMSPVVFLPDCADVTEASNAFAKAAQPFDFSDTLLKSAIYAKKPGDGSAREQAASCQRVLGAGANFAQEYATKRYRSNCINWGMLPFLTQDSDLLEVGDWVFVPNVIDAIDSDSQFSAFVLHDGEVHEIKLGLGQLTNDEKQILKDGC